MHVGSKLQIVVGEKGIPPHCRRVKEISAVRSGKVLLFEGGSDYGSPLELVYSSNDRHVIRWQGHTAWVSLGQTGYHPSIWFLIAGKITDNVLLVERILEEHEGPGRSWRALRSALIEKATLEGQA